MKIAVAGTGYVGLSNAVLLAQHNSVVALDIDTTKVEKINNKQSPIADKDISEYLMSGTLDLHATTDPVIAYSDAAMVIIAAPTNYNTETKHFDTSAVESVIHEAKNAAPHATIIIKSTIPVGFTAKMRQHYKDDNIFFSPEFLREGSALHDNLHPSRIIIGAKTKQAKDFATLLTEGALKKDIPVLFMDSTEAEAVKLFANTYLAMRVAYFNELDTYAELRNLDTASIVEGIGLDPRIGNHYNNPSFGYGGYCLPKDTRQLLAAYRDIPNDLIRAIVEANQTRMKHIAQQLLTTSPKIIGIYRLVMKSDSDNFRQSSILGVLEYLKESPIKVIIYEPLIPNKTFKGHEVTTDLSIFKRNADIIAANRMSSDLVDVAHKVYTRDLYSKD